MDGALCVAFLFFVVVFVCTRTSTFRTISLCMYIHLLDVRAIVTFHEQLPRSTIEEETP